MLIKGTTVSLEVRTEGTADEFGKATYTSTYTDVSNVLLGNPSADDMISAEQLYGKRAVYTLGIPKGDSHVWEDRIVKINNNVYHTFGFIIEGQEELVPLEWHKKIMVERFG